MVLSRRIVVLELFIAASFAAAAGTAAYHLARAAPAVHETTVTWRLATTNPGAELRLDEHDVVRAEVLDDALRALGEPTPSAPQRGALRTDVELTVDDGDAQAAVATLAVRGRTATAARVRARAVAEVVERRYATEALLRDAATLATLEADLVDLDRRIRIAQTLGLASRAGSVVELVADREDLVALRDEVAAHVSAEVPRERLVRIATASRRVSPRPLRDAGLAATVGAVVGLGLGLRWPRRRRRHAEPGPKRRRPPILATFPQVGPTDRTLLRGHAARLRVRLHDVTEHARPLVVLVAGATRRCGATLVACQLAEELTIVGDRVLLVDAHLAAPGIAASYGLDVRPEDGSTTLEWLQRPSDEHRIVRATLPSGQRLDLVPQLQPVRPTPDAADELFAAMPDILARFTHYDAVIIDGAAILEAHGGLAIAPLATGTVLVVDAGRRDDDRLFAAADRLDAAGATLFGIVENGVPESASRVEPDAFRSWLRNS